MTRRAVITQADLVRAIKAAKATGTTALRTPVGIAFVDPEKIPDPAPVTESGGNTCDGKFGRAP